MTNASQSKAVRNAESVAANTDGDLASALIGGDEAAWRELRRRYEPGVRRQLGRMLMRAMKSVMPSDAIDDIVGDLYVRLLRHDKRALRRWANGPRTAALGTWIGAIASRIALNHIHQAFLRGAVSIDDDGDGDGVAMIDPDLDPGRGATFIGAERDAERDSSEWGLLFNGEARVRKVRRRRRRKS